MLGAQVPDVGQMTGPSFRLCILRCMFCQHIARHRTDPSQFGDLHAELWGLIQEWLIYFICADSVEPNA